MTSRETYRSVEEYKTKSACVVETDESMRILMEGLDDKNHEDHIAGKRDEFSTASQFGAQFIPMLQEMKTPDAKSAAEKMGKNSSKYRDDS